MEGINIDKLHPSPGDIIIISFDIEKYDLDVCQEIFKTMRKEMPSDVSCVAIPKGAITDIISIEKEGVVDTIDEVAFSW